MDHTNTWPGSAGEHELQERYGTGERAHRFYSQQVLNHLNERMREFLAEQEMMFVATSDAKGECDNTFRAGPPGFVRVLDDERLAWPEYRGNGVLASLGNISENPHVGLLFMDFVRNVIGLHVNGRAEIVEDATMRDEYEDLGDDDIPGRRPERWVVVEVEEAYIHCAKHIPRLAKVPRDRAWGTDDVRRKGGDFFGAAKESRPWEIPSPRPQASDVAGAARMAEAAEKARVAEADWAAEVARVARTAEAARRAETTGAAPVGSPVGSPVALSVASSVADAASTGPVAETSAASGAEAVAPVGETSVADGCPTAGRHRRPLWLLGHAARFGEDR